MPGTIVEKVGPLSYKVEVAKGIWKRHVDQINERVEATNPMTCSESRDDDVDTVSLDICLDDILNSNRTGNELSGTSDDVTAGIG